MQPYIVLIIMTLNRISAEIGGVFGCLEMMNGSGQTCNRMHICLKTKQVFHETNLRKQNANQLNSCLVTLMRTVRCHTGHEQVRVSTGVGQGVLFGDTLKQRTIFSEPKCVINQQKVSELLACKCSSQAEQRGCGVWGRWWEDKGLGFWLLTNGGPAAAAKGHAG